MLSMKRRAGEPGGVAVGQQVCDRDEVLPIGFHGVRRRFASLAVVLKLGEPVRVQIGVNRL